MARERPHTTRLADALANAAKRALMALGHARRHAKAAAASARSSSPQNRCCFRARRQPRDRRQAGGPAPGRSLRRAASKMDQAVPADARRQASCRAAVGARDQVGRLPRFRLRRGQQRDDPHPQRSRLDEALPGDHPCSGSPEGAIGRDRWRGGDPRRARPIKLRRAAGGSRSARVRARRALRLRPTLPRRRAAVEEAAGGAPACPRLHHPTGPSAPCSSDRRSCSARTTAALAPISSASRASTSSRASCRSGSTRRTAPAGVPNG